MNSIKGNLVDVVQKKIYPARIFFDTRIRKIEPLTRRIDKWPTRMKSLTYQALRELSLCWLIRPVFLSGLFSAHRRVCLPRRLKQRGQQLRPTTSKCYALVIIIHSASSK